MSTISNKNKIGLVNDIIDVSFPFLEATEQLGSYTDLIISKINSFNH